MNRRDITLHDLEQMNTFLEAQLALVMIQNDMAEASEQQKDYLAGFFQAAKDKANQAWDILRLELREYIMEEMKRRASEVKHGQPG